MTDNQKILTDNIDLIIQKIAEGETYTTIAESIKVAKTTLFNFLDKPEYSARADEALQRSADSYADKAEDVLVNLKPTSNQIEFQQARELSQLYRWKSGKRNPKKYGDKIDVTSDGEKIKHEIIIKGQKFADPG